MLSEKLNEDILDNTDSLQVFKAIKFLKASKFNSCIYEGFQIEFNYYLSKRETKKSFLIIQKQKKLLKNTPCKSLLEYHIYTNKVYYYKATNDLEKFSLYAFKLLSDAEKMNDVEKQIVAIQNIVFLFTRMNEHHKNWAYIKRAEKLIESQNNNNKQRAKNYRWLAFEYEQKYTTTQRKTLLDSLLIFEKKAEPIAFKYKMYDEITNLYRAKEAYSYHKGDAVHALLYIDSAIYYGKQRKGDKNLSSLYFSKAYDHIDLGQIDEANKWMDTALVLVKEIKDSSGKMMMYYGASELYKSAGNIKKAYETFKVYTKMKDSVWNIEKVEKVNELEQKFNKVKNEKMIFELEKTKQLYTFLIVGGLLALLTLIFFFRQRSLKNKQKILETEQRLNRARINPHFFFNAMASLQNLALQEKSTQTTLYTSRLAKIMRQSLENTYEELVTVENEIDFLTQYLEIQKFRYLKNLITNSISIKI